MSEIQNNEFLVTIQPDYFDSLKIQCKSPAHARISDVSNFSSMFYSESFPDKENINSTQYIAVFGFNEGQKFECFNDNSYVPIVLLDQAAGHIIMNQMVEKRFFHENKNVVEKIIRKHEESFLLKQHSKNIQSQSPKFKKTVF